MNPEKLEAIVDELGQSESSTPTIPKDRITFEDGRPTPACEAIYPDDPNDVPMPAFRKVRMTAEGPIETDFVRGESPHPLPIERPKDPTAAIVAGTIDVLEALSGGDERLFRRLALLLRWLINRDSSQAELGRQLGLSRERAGQLLSQLGENLSLLSPHMPFVIQELKRRPRKRTGLTQDLPDLSSAA